MTHLSHLMFLPGEAGEVPRRGGGVMGTSRVAQDPSVADYRATSPRFAQGGTGVLPGAAGEVPRRGGGGERPGCSLRFQIMI